VFPALYAILDSTILNDSLPAVAVRLATGGVTLFQLRHKGVAARRAFLEAAEILPRLAPHHVWIIVNDRPDIAALLGAGGVHVGQGDLLPDDARRIVGPTSWVGVSTHNLQQLRAAAASSADYIAVGPVFPTSTKENPDPVVGIDFVRAARRETTKPLVGIGGITVDSAADVFRAGADSVAVIRDLLYAADPARRAADYLEIAARFRKRD
jgi:thiamine-phosphate pyrophosphorylase